MAKVSQGFADSDKKPTLEAHAWVQVPMRLIGLTLSFPYDRRRTWVVCLFWRFLLLFALFWLVASSYPVFGQALQVLLAQLARFWIELLTNIFPVWALDNQLFSSAAHGQIDDSCDGLECLLAFSALILAVRAAFMHKLRIVVVGLALLVLLNSFRIAHLFYLMHEESAYFFIFHLYLWQPLNVVVVFIVTGSSLVRLCKFGQDKLAVRENSSHYPWAMASCLGSLLVSEGVAGGGGGGGGGGGTSLTLWGSLGCWLLFGAAFVMLLFGRLTTRQSSLYCSKLR